MLAYLRQPAKAADLGIDTSRIVLAGHSMGGWVTVHVASRDRQLMGAVLISAADMGDVGTMPMDRLTALTADNMESLAGVTSRSMAEDLHRRAKEFGFANAASGLTRIPLLALTSDDGLAPDVDKLVTAIKAKGGTRVTEIHVPTDHGWSDHRIALQVAVIDWLTSLPTS